MSLEAFKTRTAKVRAIQFTGSNGNEINEYVQSISHGGSIGDSLEKGCWVVFDGANKFQVLPERAFRRRYEPTAPEPAPLVEVLARSCFQCKNLTSESHCMVFDEDIHSETQAAADCEAYDGEQQ